MTRRALFALAAAAVLDPERLLWRPGAKLVSIPKAMSFQGWGIPGTDPPLCVGDILTFWNDPQQYRVTATHPPGEYVRVELKPVLNSARITGLMPMKGIAREGRFYAKYVELRGGSDRNGGAFEASVHTLT
jgi:hypothetical protein